VRFGRRNDDGETAADVAGGEGAPDPAPPAAPRDADGIDLDALGPHVDLGSLLMPPVPEGTDLRLQVDEDSGQVLAVMLVSEDGMLEVRGFAAARNDDLWSEVRREIAADTARRGGTADEQEGPFGTELHVQLPVQLEDGTGGVQPSRIIGCNGPRWFLRASLLGRPAVEPEAAGPWEDVIRTIVVRRGREALPPGEALPLELPQDARRID
jgi:hypothetical protein